LGSLIRFDTNVRSLNLVVSQRATSASKSALT
jgi:hypothetical protein